MMLEWMVENPVAKSLAIKESDRQNHRRLKYAIMAFLIVLIVFSTTLGTFFLSEKLESHFAWLGGFRALGLLGIFLIAFIVNAFVIVALPIGFPLVMTIVSQNELFLAAVIYALGAVLGESIAYFLGVAGKKILKPNSYSQKAEEWLKQGGKRGFFLRGLSMTGFALTPWPPFDIIGILAGTIRYPFWEFFFFCLAGRIIKYAIIFSGYEAWKTISPSFG